MKKQTIGFLLFFLVVLGLVVYGYLKATPAPGQENQGQPIIEINPDSFDFGQIEYGQVVEYVFKVSNSGNQVLEIKKVATSCACTKAKISQSKIAPGQTAQLKVTYDSGAMSGFHAKGPQQRIIYLKSNDPIKPQAEVRIYAYVK